MPLTPAQRHVAQVLSDNRNPESHVAGGAVINRDDDTLRYSEDLDIFHDSAEMVASCADIDAQALSNAGYTVTWLLRQTGHYKAEASRAEERVRLDWTNDSAFRFFPAQRDATFGYCLHKADLAVNKVLALGGRTEIRDYLDALMLDETYLSLGALVWAACGKDAGFTPALLLDQMNQHVRFRDSDLQTEKLARPVDLRELKKQWLAAGQAAATLFDHLPEEELGCLYLNARNEPVTPSPDDAAFATLRRHRGCIRGAWPEIS
jgi:hypothetical protein